MSPDYLTEAYRRLLQTVGAPVVIRRYSGSGANRPHFDVDVIARVVDYEPEQIVGTIQQGDSKLIVLAEDVAASQIAMPLRKGDKAVIRGKEHNIEEADDKTRRVQGVLIAYELQVRG
jgi:hypothetical protein